MGAIVVTSEGAVKVLDDVMADTESCSEVLDLAAMSEGSDESDI